MAVHRKTIQPWLDEIQEAMLDLAEAKLQEKVNEGNMTTIILYLKTKGKQRGCVERSEQTGAIAERDDQGLTKVRGRTIFIPRGRGQAPYPGPRNGRLRAP
jgi:hypothetical protein